jgi:hypothetical protein
LSLLPADGIGDSRTTARGAEVIANGTLNRRRIGSDFSRVGVYA